MSKCKEVWVSTSLAIAEQGESDPKIHRDLSTGHLTLNGLPVHPLTRTYRAWLHKRVKRAVRRLPRPAAATLRERWEVIRSIPDASTHDMQGADYAQPRTGSTWLDLMRLPSAHQYPRDSESIQLLPYSHIVTNWALWQTLCIRRDASAKGWSNRRLFGTRGRFKFPYGMDYGVICFVNYGVTLRVCDITHNIIFEKCDITQDGEIKNRAKSDYSASRILSSKLDTWQK